ncbi:glycosyltransferase family 4 protein [Castellaniella sp. FW104-16D08]|uniref:glycosyltransferase family 4 protein n=1 Tax=unclassified Castellaniella TaxID=2617606 RepID=UPI0033163F4C
MRPLRIVHAEAATGFGGQERYIYRLMLALRARGHHVQAICQPHARLTTQLREAGFAVETLAMDGPWNHLKGLPRLVRFLKAGRFDVLNTHSRRETLLVGAAGRLAGVPLVVRTRHLAKPVGSLLAYTRVPKRVITPSEFVRQHLIQRGVKPEHVAVVPPAVDFPDPMPQPVLRTELGLDGQALIVGSVGVLRAEKGHEQLLAAMAPLLQRYAHLHFVVVGGGETARTKLASQAQAAGVADKVHLLGARMDVPALLPDFDIFALATHIEAAGAVFIEAGAAGLPVVGTRVGGVPEMMREGETGLLVPLFDIPALSAAIERLILDPALRRQMGEAGRKFCLGDGRFTRAALGQRTEQCYQRWLQEINAS